jgi:chromosome segregation ATPase
MWFLIKTNTPLSAASVAVVLLNGGTDAFRPAEYGNEITIQRSFTRAAGGGGYKIFNAQGKLVSTKREDLNKILDHMNIQVDNPMNVLTQDNARSFIASTDEKVKYQWFLKGTQLDQLRDSYDETEVRLRLSEKKLAASKENLPDLERKVAKLQARVKRCTQAQDLQVDIDINEGKLLWAHVKEAEDVSRGIHTLESH